eukprot:CAMPEP_0183719794 /NCGR_PEP_ID=MMETSP0737-20130205/12598_1 /TAXON_ID=385413 /ORGANISM="Thalassiosira miniscula, Strain CCMP1093" /LENGTH=35 /DNA_ID= /DNA_START= /DNA_END= /DNA_ORIENTATION=
MSPTQMPAEYTLEPTPKPTRAPMKVWPPTPSPTDD